MNFILDETYYSRLSTSVKQCIIIGAGFAGLSSACYMAKAGYSVTVLEKNNWLGGRAQVWQSKGYTFDMGPSFYWMPQVYDDFFGDFGKKVEDYYTIKRLSPAYSCVFDDDQIVRVPQELDSLKKIFESIEQGSGEQLQAFIEESKTKYSLSLDNFVYKQFSSLRDFVSPKILSHISSLGIFTSYSSLVRKKFKNPKLRAILEYPTVFLGAPGNRIPGIYTLMNYADLVLGSWYPEGGFSTVANSIGSLARELGVSILFDQEVDSLVADSTTITNVTTTKGSIFQADVVISASPYWYTESLLPEHLRQYSQAYWNSRTLAPSCLNFYVGLTRKLPNLDHHTFFLDRDWDTHLLDTYGSYRHTPQWQKEPLFYAHIASKTELNLAPPDGETLFVLIPVAPDLNDTEETRERLRTTVFSRISKKVGFDITNHIATERSYAHKDFIADYHSQKGSGFGLGHTLFQTGSFRPKNKSNTVSNLYFAGQDTIPGTSTVMSVISGNVTSKRVITDYGSN